MIENRMYLRCRMCGRGIYLGSRQGGYYAYALPTNGLENELNRFFDAHSQCGYLLAKDNADFYDHFDIEYELEPKWRVGEGGVTDGGEPKKEP